MTTEKRCEIKTIQMIPVRELYHHPENPRLEMGDLTELAESIKAIGVMQNLTVVKGHRMTRDEWVKEARAEGADKTSAEASYDPENAWTDAGYTVVIGNRRTEAAKLAGLDELPCVISDMDYRTQISTMLMENMQRADLTIYEQAQGFQMMMNLGFSVGEIAEKTGFGETTVRRRLKAAELDKKTFRQAVGLQISMDDLDRLGQIEDIKKRNELLKQYGDNNFDWMVHTAIKKQKADKVRPKAMKLLKDANAKEIPEKDKYNIYSKYESKSGWRIELDKWDGKTNFIPKADGDLYYRENGTDIELYQKTKKQKAEPVRKTPEELAEEKRIALAWTTAERAQKTGRELRLAYVRKMKVTPNNAMEMLQWALIAACVMTMGYNNPEMTLREMAGLEQVYSIPQREKDLFRYIYSMPQSKWPELIFLLFEGDEKRASGYYYGSKYEIPKWQDCQRINLCYQWLKQFGYRMSDEEEQMQDGTHQVFQKEAQDG